ncbi:MAG: cytochrome c-type biogenesis protein [Pseudomonadota bacterium]
MRALLLIFLISVTVAAGPVMSQTAEQTEAPIDLPPEDIKSRTEAVSKTLRCVVCQNQSIYDSNAPLAEDMRRLVQKRIEAGDTDEEAREYLRNLYGDYVLMSPPWQLNTILLWLGPLVLILFGGAWFLTRLRVQEGEGPADLSDEDRARIAAALSGEDTPS